MKKIPFIVITLTLLISPLFTSDAHAAITTWEVYTYGTGEALGHIFQAIANITGSNDFVTLIKIAGIIAVLGAALYGALLDERGVKILATFFALYLLLFSVKTKVAIVDYVDPGADKVINGIPIGLAVPAHLISKIGDTLTELAEETFISVDAGYDGVKYGGNGLVGGIATMNQALAVTFRLYDSPNLRADVDQFIRDCTFQDLFTGYMSWNEIMESDDLLSEIFDTDSGNITYYHDPEDSSTTVTAQCRDVGPILKSRIQAHTNDALEKLKEEIYGDLPVDIRDKIQGAYGYYLDLSWTAKRIIEQNLLMNQLPQSAVNFAQATGSDEALLAYNLAVAQEEYRHKAEVEGFYSRKLYPVIRMVFEAICYGIWPFVFIIWLTPFGGTRALKGYFILLLALQLWAPLEAVLTLIMNIYAKHNLTMSVDYLNLLTAPHIHNYTASIFSVAWRMQTFIPIIALALATGSEYALTHMFPRLIPEGPGKDLAQGNIRLGTTSVGSHSVGVLSAMNWNAGNYSWNNLRDNNFDEHNVNRFNRNEDNISLRNVNRDNVTERNVSQGNINRNNTTRDNVNWGNVSRNNITENNVKKFQEDTAPTQRKVVWTPYGPVEETTVTTPDGQVVSQRTRYGKASDPGGWGLGIEAVTGRGPGATNLVAAKEQFGMQQVASMLKTMETQGYNIGTVTKALGQMRAMENIASTDWTGQVGYTGIYMKEIGKDYNELSKMTIRQALTDIAEKGSITPQTQQILHNIAASPIGRAQLAAQGIGDRIIKPEEAKNVSAWLARQSINVRPEDLAGATAQMNVWTDKNGNIHIGFLATRKGKTVAEYDLKSIDVGTRVTDGTFMKTGTQKTIHGWMGRVQDKDQGIDHFFVSADRIQKGNMVTVKGITDQGQEVSLVQNAQTGEVISHHATAGPEGYKGALAMAAAGIEPHEVFTNKVAAARFAHDYASEIRGLYNVQISRADVDRFFAGLGGSLGGGIILSAQGFIDQRWGTDFQTISTRDLAQATTYAISTSKNMPESEKKAALQTVTDRILSLSSRKPRELPEGQKIFPEVKSEPAGKVAGSPISTITTQRDTRTEKVMQELGMLRSEKEK